MKLSSNFWLAFEVVITSLALIFTSGFLFLPLLSYHVGESLNLIDVPKCDMLTQNGEEWKNYSNNTEVEASTPMSTEDSRACREDFYKDNLSGNCVPNCYTWTELSPSDLLIYDLLLMISYAIRLIPTIFSIIFICTRYKKLLKFPTVFLLYMATNFAISSTVPLIDIPGRDYFQCFSKNLLDTIEWKPPICIVTGVVFLYSVLQQSLWWVFHVITFFWSIYFPFHYRAQMNSGKMKYIHFACVFLGLSLPLIPILAVMGSFAIETKSTGNASFWQRGAGFTQTGIPNYLCLGENRDVVYYSFLLPCTLLFLLGFLLLVFIIRLIIKQAMEKFKVKDSNKNFKFGTAEKKLLVLLIYYVVLDTIGLVSITSHLIRRQKRIECLNNYFICEQGGYDPVNPCNRSEIEQDIGLGAIFSLFYSFWSILHLLMYAVKIEDLKNLWTKCRLRFRKMSVRNDNTVRENCN